MKYREKWNYGFHKSWLMIPKLFLNSRSSEVHYQKTAMLSSQMHGIIWHLAFYKFHELWFKRMQTGNFSILKLLNFHILSALKMYFVPLLISSFSIQQHWFVLLSLKCNRIQARVFLFNNYLNSILISSCSSIFNWCKHSSEDVIQQCAIKVKGGHNILFVCKPLGKKKKSSNYLDPIFNRFFDGKSWSIFENKQQFKLV